MAFELFLTDEFKIGLSLLTISSILLLVGNLIRRKDFEDIKKNVLLIFWASIVYLIGSIFYYEGVIGKIFTIVGAVLFIITLIFFGIELTRIIFGFKKEE